MTPPDLCRATAENRVSAYNARAKAFAAGANFPIIEIIWAGFHVLTAEVATALRNHRPAILGNPIVLLYSFDLSS